MARPKKFGGLGLRRSSLCNTVLLGKLVWSLISSPQTLWVQLMNTKYLKDKFILLVDSKGTGSLIGFNY